MNSLFSLDQSVEQRLLAVVRSLPPDKQAAVLDFAEFLQNRQSLRVEARVETSVETSLETSVEDSWMESQLLIEAQEIIYGSLILAERGIDVGRAAELRSRLQTFAEDWNRPEMAVYDEL